MQNAGQTKCHEEKKEKPATPSAESETVVRSHYLGVFGVLEESPAPTPSSFKSKTIYAPSKTCPTITSPVPPSQAQPQTVPKTLTQGAQEAHVTASPHVAPQPQGRSPKPAIEKQPERLEPAIKVLLPKSPNRIQDAVKMPDSKGTTVQLPDPIKVATTEPKPLEQASDALTIFEQCERPFVIKEENMLHWKPGYEPDEQANKIETDVQRKEFEGLENQRETELDHIKFDGLSKESDNPKKESEKLAQKKEIVDMISRHESVNILVDDSKYRAACKILYNSKQANLLETLLKKDEENERVKAFLIPFVKENRKDDKVAISLISLAMKKLVYRCLKGRITMTPHMFDFVDAKERLPRVVLFEVMLMVPDFIPNKWGGAKVGQQISPDGIRASAYVADIMSGKYDVKETIKDKFLSIFSRDDDKQACPTRARSASTPKDEKEEGGGFRKLLALASVNGKHRKNSCPSKESAESVQDAGKLKKTFRKKTKAAAMTGTESTETSQRKVIKSGSRQKTPKKNGSYITGVKSPVTPQSK